LSQFILQYPTVCRSGPFYPVSNLCHFVTAALWV